MNMSIEKQTKKKKVPRWKRKQNIFFGLMMVIPMLHKFVWYVVLNANSLSLAFREFDFEANRYVFAGLKNFKDVITEFTTSPIMLQIVKNSFTVYAIGLCFTMPLTVLFAFYLYKKFPGHDIFKFILYLPSIISGIVVTLVFTYFVERFIPGLVLELTGNEIQGLMSNPELRFPMLLIYGIWFGFGGSMLYYLGSMNAISPEMVEAAKIDGVNLWQEFRYITLPMIYPTLTTVITTGIVGLFTNQLSLVTFYGTNASSELQTIGYWLFATTLKSSETSYPYLSAAGLLITFIVAPLTFIIKHYMEKYGPNDGGA